MFKKDTEEKSGALAVIKGRTPSEAALKRATRRATTARLLAERVPMQQIVDRVQHEYDCGATTVRDDIKGIYSEWANALKDEQASNLAMCVSSCLTEIRRLRPRLAGAPDKRGRVTEVLSANAEFKYSMALLKWETHLAKLQGLLIGRVDVTSDGEPINVVMKIPAGPFADVG